MEVSLSFANGRRHGRCTVPAAEDDDALTDWAWIGARIEPPFGVIWVAKTPGPERPNVSLTRGFHAVGDAGLEPTTSSV